MKPPCDGLTDLYFPDHGERPEALQERLDLCRRICNTCPLILACSIKAHRNREWGIWAGRMHWGADRTPNEQRTRRKGQPAAWRTK